MSRERTECGTKSSVKCHPPVTTSHFLKFCAHAAANCSILIPQTKRDIAPPNRELEIAVADGRALMHSDCHFKILRARTRIDGESFVTA